MDSLLQKEPKWGEVGTERTKFYAVYDKKAIYFAVICDDEDINGIKATANERDSRTVEEDDYVYIFLDTFGDGINGYGFYVTPIGIQKDLKLGNGGSILYPEWDGKWESWASIDSDRWSVEIEIPFSEINYKQGLWKFQFARYIARKQELDMACLANSLFESSKTLNVRLENFKPLKEICTINFTPYGLIKKKVDSNISIGANLALKIKKTHRFVLAANMDYAEIESDMDYIDLDLLPLYRSEKRPFFLEGGEHLIDYLGLSYTRAITNILYGAKYFGRIDNISLSSFVVQDTIEKRNYFLLRPEFQIYKGIQLGGLATYTTCLADTTNRVLGVDVSANFPGEIHINCQCAFSNLEDNSKKMDGSAYYIGGWRILSQGFGLLSYYKKYESDFSALMGLPMSGFEQFFIRPQYIFCVNNSFLRSTKFSFQYRNWKLDNEPYIEEICPSFKIKFQNNWAITPYLLWGKMKLGDREMHNRYCILDVKYTPGGWNQIDFGCMYGDYLGFRMTYPYIILQIKLNKKLEWALDFENQILASKDSTKKNLIITFRGGTQIIGNFGLRHFIQWSDITHKVESNILFKYDFSTFSHIYLGVNNTLPVEEGGFQELFNLDKYTILFKLAYRFSYKI
ncbi:hypothetical protein DRP43_06250 [candidate division TA06 bacterium]|uniref:Carbohydrate-binding domain-containing protein n=1 Tax=candidate division TA06 bacterium TaxID=2250710 RepID=A0A660SAV7_UNCT6|nr:MAG: hypothetical protein DRP43_06250 [candidate division TA06 bacterium]